MWLVFNLEYRKSYMFFYSYLYIFNSVVLVLLYSGLFRLSMIENLIVWTLDQDLIGWIFIIIFCASLGWLCTLQIDFCEDYGSIFNEMLKLKICVGHSLLYVWYALFLESKGNLYDAQMVYQMGILRYACSLMRERFCVFLYCYFEV